MTVAESLDTVRARMEASLKRAGRALDAVTLVAVTKTQPVERVVEAFDLGVRDFGENTVVGLATKAETLAASGRQARWHFIGRLQKNKINKLLPWVHLVHSVDSVELAAALSARAPLTGLDVMIQVNIGREPQKGGVDPARALEIAALVSELPRLALRGFMAIPPVDLEPRPFFEALLVLSKQLVAKAPKADFLSMGMSDDFELAIECGATHVRVGTAIFGERPNLRGRGAA
jgi:pyridoxal phosphate enzyme (YggS family)